MSLVKQFTVAVVGGQTHVVRKLLASEPSLVTFTDPTDGNSALIVAAMRGDAAMVQALLDTGASINWQNCSGMTALYHAALCHHDNVAKLLLQHGANPSIASIEDGSVPLHAVAARDELAILASSKGIPRNFAIDLVQALVKYGGAVNARDYEGDSALHYAVREDRVQIARKLISLGAEKGLKNEDDESPEDLVRTYGSTGMKALFFGEEPGTVTAEPSGSSVAPSLPGFEHLPNELRNWSPAALQTLADAERYPRTTPTSAFSPTWVS